MEKVKIKTISLVRIGLALAFLANSLTAFFMPAEFIELIKGSFLISIAPASAFLIVIGINDAVLATLLFLNEGRKIVPVWAALWLIGVSVVRGISFDTLEELGFLFMALALMLNANQKNSHEPQE